MTATRNRTTPAKKRAARAAPAQEITVPTVTFSEDEETGTVTASFPSMNGSKPFVVTLKNMHWGLVEDLDNMSGEGDNRDILTFLHEYIEGGPRAVPFKHTMTVFEAIRGYIEQTSEMVKKESRPD